MREIDTTPIMNIKFRNSQFLAKTHLVAQFLALTVFPHIGCYMSNNAEKATQIRLIV